MERGGPTRTEGLRIEVAGLKVKASTWGGLAGLITVLAALLLQALTK